MSATTTRDSENDVLLCRRTLVRVRRRRPRRGIIIIIIIIIINNHDEFIFGGNPNASRRNTDNVLRHADALPAPSVPGG
jgi:hypothetical protein